MATEDFNAYYTNGTFTTRGGCFYPFRRLNLYNHTGNYRSHLQDGCLFLKNTLRFFFFHRLALCPVYKRLEYSSQEDQNICEPDCFLATGWSVLHAWHTAVRCSTLCRVASVIGSGCEKTSTVRAVKFIFPACSLKIGPRDRICLGWGEAKPKPLLWIQREQCLSSNLILPKSFMMWVFLNFLLKLEASRIFWHFPFFFFLFFKLWYVTVCQTVFLKGKKWKGCFLFLFPRGR